ncbi:hypothetical protein K437DRAFT_265978 [Tilletiaria anomala UBC 951]|uniref:Hemerythrin-like domain-containing protein n=1 Tax=Tilletiaria anomala (strain ATCC 24038 / CBS 436.72 / UBC 951) TaxID=1037660 RepID=A0A066WKD9_TILAU|nr:uncharacterized protein K437DRAFT_265978 [Tilletiaria anomala UBC 951]KDN53038.1 hypothetical protein K437DRAFT_265978 [Tilletiaria anomala UBC 951]
MANNSTSHSNGNVPFKDFLKMIKNEHENIKDWKHRFNAAFEKKDRDEMSRIANSTIRSAALHADSEEVSVYKALEQHGFKEQADKDRRDHQHVKQLMSKLEQTSINDSLEHFHKLFNEACDLFIKHADDEEDPNVHGSLVQLRNKVSDERAAEIGEQFLKARKMAPERPHPEAPQGGGMAQKAAAAVTKATDMFTSANHDYAQPKHDFPSVRT